MADLPDAETMADMRANAFGATECDLFAAIDALAEALRESNKTLMDVRRKSWGDTSRGTGIGGQMITWEGDEEYEMRVTRAAVARTDENRALLARLGMEE